MSLRQNRGRLAAAVKWTADKVRLEAAVFEGRRFNGVGFAPCVAIGGGRCRGMVDFIAGRGSLFQGTRGGGLALLAAVGALGEADSVMVKAAVFIFRERWICQ